MSVIGANEKALKDKNTKKEHRAGLEAQKKKAEADLKPLNAKMDAAEKEYDVCTKTLELLTKANQPIQDTIAKLQTELQTAQKGQTDYGKARNDFKTWYSGELGKMKTAADGIGKAARMVETSLVMAEAAADKNELDKAQTAAADTQKSANLAKLLLEKLEAMAAGINAKKSEGRNLSVDKYNIVAADVQVHAALNKSILTLFANEDTMKVRAREAVAECQGYAETAATRAAQGAKTADNMSVALGKSLTALQAIDVQLDQLVGRTWGKIIDEEGAIYTRTVKDLKADPATQSAPALKTYEQASVYIPEALDRAQRINERIQSTARKALAGVPNGLRGELAPQMQGIETVAEKWGKFLPGYATKATKTLAELEKINVALGELEAA